MWKNKIKNKKSIIAKNDGIKRRKKVTRIPPYAHINWEKVSKLFRQTAPPSEKHLFPSVKELLHILTAVGTIGMIFAFPGAAPALGSLIIGNNNYSRWRTKKIISQLSKQKLVTIKENEDSTVTVKITKNGIARALTYQLDSMRLREQKKWDGKWRVVIFDIPERYKKIREIFRARLRQLSLYPLQESVYISPYPCFNEIEFLRELYGISFTVRYLLVDKPEDARQLKHHFELK